MPTGFLPFFYWHGPSRQNLENVTVAYTGPRRTRPDWTPRSGITGLVQPWPGKTLDRLGGPARTQHGPRHFTHHTSVHAAQVGPPPAQLACGSSIMPVLMHSLRLTALTRPAVRSQHHAARLHARTALTHWFYSRTRSVETIIGPKKEPSASKRRLPRRHRQIPGAQNLVWCNLSQTRSSDSISERGWHGDLILRVQPRPVRVTACS